MTSEATPREVGSNDQLGVVNEGEGPEVVRRGVFDCQVCVPSRWTDAQIKAFADEKNECGTEHGWHIRRAGDPALSGCAERVQCSLRSGFVHLMLDA